ncbi:MAG: M48 family metalloprotease [Gemmatimonadota bacterium]
MTRRPRSRGWSRTAIRRALLLALLAAAPAGCATNPATGEKELSLVSESQEIQIGRASDAEVVQTLGLYGGAELQGWVQSLGASLAAVSERPNLPWTFRVADDPTVNAFALPGGFVYVTRGLLAHLNSEAELAGVLGHEIGHVTARHTASRITNAQLANLGFGIGSVLLPDLARYGDLAGAGLQLLFLKYSRDDERQADELSLRYLLRRGYDPRPMTDVFTVLRRVSELEGAGRLPDWLASHPNPEERRVTFAQAVDSLGRDFSSATVDREPYLRRLDGMVFGANPREGFFRDGVFHHPDLQFRMTFPAGWSSRNAKSSVAAVSPQRDAVVELALAGEASLQAAARAFTAQRGVRTGRFERRDVNGLPAVYAAFEAAAGDVPLLGIALFVEHGGRVYRMLGYSSRARWPAYERGIAAALASFAPERDPAVLAVQPARLELVTLPAVMTVEEFSRRWPSALPAERVALINHLEPGERAAAGTLLKRVVGGAS